MYILAKFNTFSILRENLTAPNSYSFIVAVGGHFEREVFIHDLLLSPLCEYIASFHFFTKTEVNLRAKHPQGA